ncbi:NLI interacting factor-like phosphatase-domain-containing protein [Glomus cerebriforme]|uniref:NLI interacting factor-like phosphatase-domain-containing protein n=1 Tax=Glomus cerebriforme TaxID=658196 RepID=A0A397TCA0_9GLOM|nr:NLI interacting factor-like phosphatase-domain-containing protein [Glomus cerebriforme]
MLASTQSSSLVSQEIYTTTSNTTPSASSSNSTINGESSVNSSNNLSECLTASSSTTPPSYFLLYYWTILYTYITNIFSKSTAKLRRHSTGEHAYMTQSSVLADINNNINNNTNNNNSPQQPLRRSPRFKSKKQLQQQISSSSIDSITPLKVTNSSIRLRSNAKQVYQSSMTSTPSFSSMMKTKTLILDLDETLIHSTSRGSRADAHMIEVMVDNHACLYYVYKRPHVDHFLKKVSEWYKVVIFTASMPEYADPVIDWLDPNKNLICNRFFRQSCTNRNGAYIKDLTIVEPDLSKVCLVDNSPISYAMHQENGIAIEGWINDPHDEALLDLLPFLDALRFTEDVRSILSLATY